MTCNICAEKFNKSTNSKVICPWSDCKFESCKSCVRRYLIETTNDPCCMNCRKPLDDNFLVENLNRSYIEKDYKRARKDILLDTELAKLQETMPLAERQKQINKEFDAAQVYSKQINELNKQIKKLKDQKYFHDRRRHQISHGLPLDGEEAGPSQDRRQFIMNCPADNCKGFLSSQYKCGLCEKFTCPHCFEIIGDRKDIPHECDPNNVASASLLKKETKPCPQCAVPIFKISGCSQMWCTQCKIAFDYNTLKIVTGGHIHNPHYYAYMRNAGLQARNPGDVPCGGLVTFIDFGRLIQWLFLYIYQDKDEREFEYSTFENIHRVINHVTNHELPTMRIQVTNLQDFQNLRVDYILNKISKEDMRDKIYQKDTKRKSLSKILQIYELLSTIGIENIRFLYEDGMKLYKVISKYKIVESNGRVNNIDYMACIPGDEKKKFKDDMNLYKSNLIDCGMRLDKMREYVNNELIKVSVTFNRSVISIEQDWSFKSKKYLISDLNHLTN